MARRNANGDGTLYRRKDGRWEGAVWVRTASGDTKRKSVYGKTRAEAYAKVTETKVKQQQGHFAPDKIWRLGEYLDYWLDEVVRPARRANTYAQCETICRLYLKPDIGTLRLDRLSVPAIQAYLNGEIARGIPVSRVYVIKKVLSSALTRALKEEHITRNCAQLVELPPYHPPEIQPWSATEAKAFLNAATGSTYAAAFFLLLFYGLRRGEVLGLRWQDVDVTNGMLRIRQQLQRVGRQLLVSPLKTHASQRDLPLLPVVAAVLAQHRKHNVTSPEHDLVFTTSTGTRTEPSNFVRDYDRICKEHGLRRIKVHDMRHTTATLLKNAGVADRDIQRILGHARVTTTQELYQHSDMDSRRDGLGRLEAAFQPDPSDHKSPQTKPSGGLMDVVDGNGCRQLSRQIVNFVANCARIISGAGEETLTLDLFLGKSIGSSVGERATSVRTLLEDRRRRWIIGAVAVNLAVKKFA